MTKGSEFQRALHEPTFINRKTGKKMPNDTGWQDRHMNALRGPRGFELAIVGMLNGWAKYADEHHSHYGSRVTDDGVMGAEWVAIGKAVLALLNGETGRFDCGTLYAFICDTLESVGVRDV